MPDADVDGLIGKFRAMAVRQALGQDVSAALHKLVTLTEVTLMAQAGSMWLDEARRVRG